MANETAPHEISTQVMLNDIKQIIEQARTQVKQTVNSAMVIAYWQIGHLIVEDEQQGKNRAQYGKAQLKMLSSQLTQEFGKGFDITNLRNMRRFYLAFEKRETLSLELSWSHYNVLALLDNVKFKSYLFRIMSVVLQWIGVHTLLHINKMGSLA